MGLYLDPEAWDDRLPVVLELFPHLRTKSDLRAGFMSGGERQMLAMGRALMMNPDVLLLDEPSAGLSPANQDHVFDRVREICDSGVSIIMVEQNARRCLQICDRAYVMDQGKNAYTGPGQELLHDPKIIDLYLGTLGRAD
jgi:branched-chain amino acid transport system ATP-binding protein